MFYLRPPPTRTDPPVVIAMHGFSIASSPFIGPDLQQGGGLDLPGFARASFTTPRVLALCAVSPKAMLDGAEIHPLAPQLVSSH